MPVGSHTLDPDVFDVWYTGIGYKNLELSVFKNSFRDWTLALFYKRAWYFSKKFHIAAGIGLMYGYKGRLQDVEGVIFKNSFLFTGSINPVIGFDLDYRIFKKTSIHVSITPLVIVYGFKYYF